MPGYTVVDIGEDRLEAAYFLVRAVSPDMSLQDWQVRGRAILASGGILGLCGPGDMLAGLLFHHKHQTLQHGAVLSVDTVAVFELLPRGGGRRVLLEAAAHVAERLGCSAIAYPARDRMFVELRERQSGATSRERSASPLP